MKLSAPPVVNHYDIERRVAVEIMGLPAVEFNERTKCPYCGEVGRMTIGRIWCCRCEEWYYHPYKNYRDSMIDTMEVIEKMDSEGWCVWIISQVREGPKWAVQFEAKGDREGHAVGDSLPEAICNAALAAVGKQ